MGDIGNDFRDHKKHKEYKKLRDKELVQRIYAGKLTKNDIKIGKKRLIDLALDHYMRSSEYLTAGNNKDYFLNCEQNILEQSLRYL